MGNENLYHQSTTALGAERHTLGDLDQASLTSPLTNCMEVEWSVKACSLCRCTSSAFPFLSDVESRHLSEGQNGTLWTRVQYVGLHRSPSCVVPHEPFVFYTTMRSIFLGAPIWTFYGFQFRSGLHLVVGPGSACHVPPMYLSTCSILPIDLCVWSAAHTKI